MKYRLIVIAVILMSAARMASGDSLDVVQGDSSWRPFVPPSNSGAPFWNNQSLDGQNCNIGYWLSGTGACAAFNAPSPNVTPAYLGDATTGFKFTKAPATQSVTVTSRLDVTAYRNTNEVGWFDTAAPAVLNPLFVGAGPVGASVTFIPSASYGFYLKSPEGTYLTTGTGDNRTHFSVFQLTTNGSYLFGLEDMWTNSDIDYNDMVFEIVENAVPEPATMLLFGSGLAGIGAAVRRRRKR